MTNRTDSDYQAFINALDYPILGHEKIERPATHPYLARVLYRVIEFIEEHLDPDTLRDTADRWAGKPCMKSTLPRIKPSNARTFTWGISDPRSNS